jgi:hypothetical protein
MATRTWRQTISWIAYPLAVISLAMLAADVVWSSAIWAASGKFQMLHSAWLSPYSDNQGFSRLNTFLWCFAVGVFLFSLFGIGAKRRSSLLMAGAIILGLPALLLLLFNLTEKAQIMMQLIPN